MTLSAKRNVTAAGALVSSTSARPCSPTRDVKPALHSTPDAGNATHRLPCRGCLASCSHFATCNGRPWRTL
jgi:hypothetical protein